VGEFGVVVYEYWVGWVVVEVVDFMDFGYW